MDLAIIFDWFTNESMDTALQATEWTKRETYLRLALMWAAAAQQTREEASTRPETHDSDNNRSPSVRQPTD